MHGITLKMRIKPHMSLSIVLVIFVLFNKNLNALTDFCKSMAQSV